MSKADLLSRMPVVLGALQNGELRVVSGIERGDVLATSGSGFLREGLRVRRFAAE